MSGTGDRERRRRLVVVGSINVDLVVRAERLPRPGETLVGHDFAQLAGGKGANQAVAAARLGAEVALIGRVGDDPFGREMLARIQTEGIDTRHVRTTPECGTGLAAIQVAADGQNSIVIVPGANGALRPADVHAARETIRAADMVLVQLEIPLDTVLAVLASARETGVPVLLDPAPAPRDFPAELLDVDYLCPNETEAATLTCGPVETDQEIRRSADELLRRGARCVLITLGERGVWVAAPSTQPVHVLSFPVHAVDTTAAGDAFAAAFAIRRAEGATLAEAVTFGCAAGALCASRAGAQPSLPTRAEVEQMLQHAVAVAEARNGEQREQA